MSPWPTVNTSQEHAVPNTPSLPRSRFAASACLAVTTLPPTRPVSSSTTIIDLPTPPRALVRYNVKQEVIAEQATVGAGQLATTYLVQTWLGSQDPESDATRAAKEHKLREGLSEAWNEHKKKTIDWQITSDNLMEQHNKAMKKRDIIEKKSSIQQQKEGDELEKAKGMEYSKIQSQTTEHTVSRMEWDAEDWSFCGIWAPFFRHRT